MAKVSHIVSGFTQKYSTALPTAQSSPENHSVCAFVSWPLAVGRHAVRAMRRSMCCSTMQLKAAAAPATSQMPTVAAPSSAMLGSPGSASSMPMSAQNTISCTTRGLVSE